MISSNVSLHQSEIPVILAVYYTYILASETTNTVCTFFFF